MQLKITTHLWKFFYHMVRKPSKRVAKPLSRSMTEIEWNEWLNTKKELGL